MLIPENVFNKIYWVISTVRFPWLISGCEVMKVLQLKFFANFFKNS